MLSTKTTIGTVLAGYEQTPRCIQSERFSVSSYIFHGICCNLRKLCWWGGCCGGWLHLYSNVDDRYRGWYITKLNAVQVDRFEYDTTLLKVLQYYLECASGHWVRSLGDMIHGYFNDRQKDYSKRSSNERKSAGNHSISMQSRSVLVCTIVWITRVLCTLVCFCPRPRPFFINRRYRLAGLSKGVWNKYACSHIDSNSDTFSSSWKHRRDRYRWIFTTKSLCRCPV